MNPEVQRAVFSLVIDPVPANAKVVVAPIGNLPTCWAVIAETA